METIITITFVAFSAILGIAILAILVLLAICSVHSWYLYIFEHQSWKVWKEVYTHAKECVYDSESSYIPSITFYCRGRKVILWLDNNTASIHEEDGSCLFGEFDKRRSEKLFKKVLAETGYQIK